MHHRPTLKLTMEGGEQITTTAAHPFYVKGKGFVKAGALSIGNAIVTRAGPALKVIGVHYTGKTETVYNFEVKDFHTYFVGKVYGGLWVHNICRPRPSKVTIPDGNLNGGWDHINARHITGDHPGGPGDLFPPGTSRAQLEEAANQLVSKGVRASDPSLPVQTFEGRIKVNGQRGNYRTIIHMPSQTVITIFLILGGN